MADGISVEIDGLDKIADELEKLPPRIAQAAARPALNAAGQVFEAALHSTTPKVTGELDTSIGHKVTVSRNLDRMTVVVGPRYMGGHKETSTDPGVRAKFLEMGTRKMAPRFFIRRAFEMAKDAAVDAALAVLRGVLDKLPKD